MVSSLLNWVLSIECYPTQSTHPNTNTHTQKGNACGEHWNLLCLKSMWKSKPLVTKSQSSRRKVRSLELETQQWHLSIQGDCGSDCLGPVYNYRRGKSWKVREYTFQGETEKKLHMKKAENEQLESLHRAAGMCIRGAKVEDGFPEGVVNSVRNCRKLNWIEPVLPFQGLLPNTSFGKSFCSLRNQVSDPCMKKRSPTQEKRYRPHTTQSFQMSREEEKYYQVQGGQQHIWKYSIESGRKH